MQNGIILTMFSLYRGKGREAFTGERLVDTSGLGCPHIQALVLYQIWIRPGSSGLR